MFIFLAHAIENILLFTLDAIITGVFDNCTGMFKIAEVNHEFICMHSKLYSSMHCKLIMSSRNTLQVHS